MRAKDKMMGKKTDSHTQTHQSQAESNQRWIAQVWSCRGKEQSPEVVTGGGRLEKHEAFVLKHAAREQLSAALHRGGGRGRGVEFLTCGSLKDATLFLWREL